MDGLGRCCTYRRCYGRRCSTASPLYDAFEPGEFFIREARCSFLKLVQETFVSLFGHIFFHSIKIFRTPDRRAALTPGNTWYLAKRDRKFRAPESFCCWYFFRWGRCRLGRCTSSLDRLRTIHSIYYESLIDLLILYTYYVSKSQREYKTESLTYETNFKTPMYSFTSVSILISYDPSGKLNMKNEQAGAGRDDQTRLAIPSSQTRMGTGKCLISLFS